MGKLERRGYQFKLLNLIRKEARNKRNIILELDAGLGKRIVSYLLYRQLSKEERALMITPTVSSLEDTVSTFERLKEDEKLDKLGYIYGRTGKYQRKKALKQTQFLISTPISLAHTLKKFEDERSPLSNFDFLLLNEIDKVVRRTAVRRSKRRSEEKKEENEGIKFVKAKNLNHEEMQREARPLFTYPWNSLREKISPETCIVGMSATLRDKHMVKEGETGRFRSELETLVKDFLPHKEVRTIRMGSLISSTDLKAYLPRNISIVKPIGVLDANIQKITSDITKKMEEVKEKIYARYPDLFEKKDFKHIKKGFALLPKSSSLREKFFRLSLYRKFVVASVPSHYRKFLRRLPRGGQKEDLLSLVPEESGKVEKISEMVKSWIDRGKKVAVMVSYIRTGVEIKRELEKQGNVFLVTGKTHDRKEILDTFKTSEKSTLILTPVGERDLDLTSVDLLIIHDVVNTVKTMYQRLKRARGALVTFLYYKNTHEKRKVYSVLDKIREKYPWTTKIAG